MFRMISLRSFAWSSAILGACLAAQLLSARAESVLLSVVRVGSPVEKSIPSKLEAVIPADVRPEGTHKVRFYRGSIQVKLAGSQAQLAWFSYTNPPADKHTFFVEADMPVFGGFIHKDKLYVCSPISPEASVPALNAFLYSMSVERLDGTEARDFAMLSAKCIGAGKIYGDSDQIADPLGRELLARVASFPSVETAENQIKVVFYSWEPLKGSVVKWSFVFGPIQILSIHQEDVPGGQLIFRSRP